MDLHEIVIPAVEEIHSWNGTELINLEANDQLQIKSNGAQYLKLKVPAGKTYSFRIKLTIEEV